MVEVEYDGTEEWEEEEEVCRPRSPMALLPRAFLHFLMTLVCIAAVFYPFYQTGQVQQWLAEFRLGVFHQEEAPTGGYQALAKADAIAVGIPPDLFVRQIDKESSFDPTSLSPSGAEGIAQLMPDTASSLGVDPWNPSQALRAAAHLMATYTHTYDGDYAKALAAYNGGPGVVQNAVSGCGMAWMACLPGETQNYIDAIMG